MAYTNQSGVNIYYEVVGDCSKPVLLMNHGLGNSVANWYSLGFVDLLKPHFCLVMYDGRGFGKSEKCYQVADYAPENLMSDIAAVLDAIGIEHCHFFGNSRGGALGLMASKYLPTRFQSFILGGMEPCGVFEYASQFALMIKACLPDQGEEFVRNIEKELESSFPDGDTAKAYAANDLSAMLAATEAMLEQADFSEDFAKLNVPKLLYVGEADPYHDAMQAYALEIGCPFQVLPGYTHAQAYWDAKTVTPQL